MGRHWLLTAGSALSLALSQALAQAPAQPIPVVPPDLKKPIVQVQQPAPVAPDLSTLTPGSTSGLSVDQPTGPVTPPVSALQGTPDTGGGAPGTNVRPETANIASAAGAPSTAISGGGGAAGEALNAPDASDLLTKSVTSTGVDIQRRNPIIADPRIRGLRNTQFNAYADGAYYIPSRLDLDSVISRFDPGSIRDILVIKGPYSPFYGPGFAFVDIGTLDSPRYDCLQHHGRTSLGYQTNGQRWDGVQSILVGDCDWGFRATYNILQGNDYEDGFGNPVSSSYLSNNVSFALGVDFSPVSKLEFKGFSVVQNGIELPGYYFDIDQLNAEGYTMRYTLLDQGLFDKLTLDTWYNYTASSGNTLLNPKQRFVDTLLRVSFDQPGSTPRYDTSNPNPVGNPFLDLSNTRFAGRSIGYRLATSWGPKDAPLLTLGTDLNVFGQQLQESILFRQFGGANYVTTNLNTGIPLQPGQVEQYYQSQGIPASQSANPGIFFQSDYKLTEDFKIRTGGRYDYVSTQSNPRIISGNIDFFGPPVRVPQGGGSRFDDRELYRYSVNPNDTTLAREFNLGSGFLQGEYAVSQKITATAAVGYAMRAPTLTELYASGPFIGVLQQGTSRLIGDPNLKSEKLLQVDLGLRAEFETWQAGINGFYAWVDDFITYDVNRFGQGLTQVIYTNTDRATLSGAELFGQVEATSWLTTFGTLSYVKGVDQTLRDNRRQNIVASSRRDTVLNRVPDTEALPGVPPLESRLGLRFHECSKNPRWQVELSARVVNGQNYVATTLGEFPTAGFTVFDIRTFWRARDNWLLTAGIENVGDIRYREHLDPISGNLINTNPLYRPGINFYFGSQVTY